MIIPDAAGGHLYKWIAVLGTFILVSSVYGMSVTLDSSDSRLRETIAKAVFARDVDDEERSYWKEYLNAQKRNTEVVLWFLETIAFIGGMFAIIGIRFWYCRIQRFEDERRRLENLQLEQVVEERASVKRLVT